MQGKPRTLSFPAQQQSFSLGKAVFPGKQTQPAPEQPEAAIAEQNQISSSTPVRLLDSASQLFTRYQRHFRPR